MHSTPSSHCLRRRRQRQAEDPTSEGSGALDDEEEACIAQELEREGWLVPSADGMGFTGGAPELPGRGEAAAEGSGSGGAAGEVGVDTRAVESGSAAGACGDSGRDG